MKPILTQETNQSLKILLISQSNKISGRIKDFLQANLIDVFQISIADLINNSEVLERIRKEEFYKIVWTYGFGCYQRDEYKFVGEILKKRKEPKIIVSRVLSQVEEKCFYDWQKLSKENEDFILYINKNFNNDKIILGNNVVGFNNHLNFPFKAFLQEINDNQILDPEIYISLILFENFVEEVEKELFNPTKVKILIKSNPEDSNLICEKIKKIHQSYYNSDLKIKKKACKLRPFFLNKKQWKVKKTKDELDKIIDQQLRISSFFKEAGYLKTEKHNKALLKTQVVEKTDSLASEATDKDKKQTNYSFVKESIILINNRKKNKIEDEKVETELKKIFDNGRVEKKTERRAKKVDLFSQINHKTRHKKAIFWVGLGVVLTGVIIGLNLAVLSINYQRARNHLISLTKMFDSEAEYQYSSFASDVIFKKQLKLLDKIFNINIVENSKKLLGLLEKTDSVYQKSVRLEELKKSVFLKTMNKQDVDLNELISRLDQESASLYQELSLLQAEVSSVDKTIFNPTQQKQISIFQDTLIQHRKGVTKNQQIIPLLPSLLAVNSKRNYLLIMQDNQELRPTGGFVQAVAIITVENGSISNQEVVTANKIDEQISGKVVAPPEINKLLGEENLYLRDANWDPDFPTTADQISWFYQEIYSQQVDGVLAINYFLIEDLLEEWGDLLVINYEEEINSNNLFEKLSFHATEEKDQQLKETFQVSVFKTVLDKLKNLSEEEVSKTLKIIANSIKEKETLISLSNDDENKVFETLSWTGSIINPSCPTEFSQNGNCVVDSLYQVEANVSINKVNPYIKRKISHEFEILENNEVRHLRKVSFRNDSRSKFWPLGAYKFYLKFYLPADVRLQKVEIDGVQISDDKIVTYIEHGKKVIGILSSLDPQAQQDLVISYISPFKVEQNDSYLFFNQSQPGVKYEGISLIARYPSSLSPTLVAPQAEVGDNLILFDQNLLDHTFAGIQF